MNSNGIQIRVGDIFHIIWKRRIMILLLTVLGLFLGLLLYGVNYLQGAMSREYTVEASVTILTKTRSGSFAHGVAGPSDDDFALAQDMAGSVIYLMKSDRVLSAVIDKDNLIGVTTKNLLSNLSLSQHEKNPIIEMKIRWRSVEEGAAILNSIIENTTEALQEAFELGTLKIVNEPISSSWNIGERIGASIWLVMAIMGCAVGVGIAILELLMRPTLLNIKDVETLFGLETFGAIPEEKNAFRGTGSILVNDGSASSLKENYSAAAHILNNRLGTKKEGCKCFYITSATAGEGKTAAAANLAVQLSDMEYRVLLLDLNFKSPKLSGLFLDRVDFDHSLNAIYHGEADVAESIITLTGYLDLLPTVLERSTITIDNVLFDMIDKLKEHYDYIIIDTAPIGEVAGVLSLNRVADTALYVIRYDYASMQQIQDSLATLDKSGIRVIGSIINQIQSNGSSPAPRKTTRTTEENIKTFFSEDDFSIDSMEQKTDENQLSDEEASGALLKYGIESTEENASPEMEDQRDDAEDPADRDKSELDDIMITAEPEPKKQINHYFSFMDSDDLDL